MSAVDPADPRYSPHGNVTLLAIRNGRLVATDRATIGGWVEGAMFITPELIGHRALRTAGCICSDAPGDELVALDPIAFKDGGPASLGRGPN